MVSAGGIIVIFLGHLSAVQVEEGGLCKLRRVFVVCFCFKERSFYVFLSCENQVMISILQQKLGEIRNS